MSQEQKKSDNRYIGKIKNITTQSGSTFQKILIENPNPQNADGTPCKYYKGALLWIDADGRQFQVKQLDIFVPQNGMGEAGKHGFIANVTIDLNKETSQNEKGYGDVTLLNQ